MDRTFDATDVRASYSPSETVFTPISERFYVPSHEDATNVATNENLDGCEQKSPWLTPVDELLKINHWKPADPQFCKEIAAHYGQSKRNIQKWFVDLREIAPWFSEAELRLSDDRYTPLAVELLGHRYFTGYKKKWAAVLAERFADRAAASAPAAESPVIRPEVLPRENQQPFNGDRASLPPVDRTAAGSLVPTGSSYLSALEEEELELQQLEAQELELLERMNGNLERLTQNQTQWQRTNDLRRQRLLRQTRLEAAALATELEAEFDETLRESQYNIRRGNVGKSPAETPGSQSAELFWRLLDNCDFVVLSVSPTPSTPAMELFTVDESLKDTVLELERAVIEADQMAITYEVGAIGLQITQREKRLASIRHRQAQNQLAQAVLTLQALT